MLGLALTSSACANAADDGASENTSADAGPGSNDSSTPPLPAITPNFGAAIESTVVPRPITGGTLLIMRDERTAIAADPDRDQVFIADIAAGSSRRALSLRAGDQPARAVE